MKVSNVDRLKKKIAAMPKAIRDDLRTALGQGADEIVSLAKSFAPTDSGDLRDSIDHSFGLYLPANANVRGVGIGGGGHDLAVTIHAGDERAYYAGWVEFGTAPHSVAKGGGTVGGRVKARFGGGTPHPGAAAHPFFYPAYRLGKRRARSRITRAMNKAIKRVAGK